jgi:CRP/FNR family cyclic AMP-dependent transcriptional regulator
MAASTIEVLRREPDLAMGLSGEELERARSACVAKVFQVGKGDLEPQITGASPNGFGLLAISGYLLRRVGREGRFGAELLGPGDLLRPWQVDGDATLPFEPCLQAITPVEVADLDVAFARRAAAFPAIAIQLADRALQRSRHLAVAMAIQHHPRVDVRLHLLFWHYADRWGRVDSTGISVRLPLTHSAIAELVGARRPTVSTALGALAREGRILRSGDRWHLSGEPPIELGGIRREVPSA